MHTRYLSGSLAALCLGLMFVLAGCGFVNGSGTSKTETRNVSGFNTVALAGEGQLTIHQTGTESLTITADDNILPLLTSDVRGGRLNLGVASNTILQPKTAIRYDLTVKDLSSIDLSGSGNVVADTLSNPSLDIGISGSGSMTLTNLMTTTLTLDISGSGSLRLSNVSAQHTTATISGSGATTIAGQTHDLTLRISGSGKFQGDSFASATADISVSGSGDVTVRVSDTLHASVSGSGNIAYYGSPQLSYQGSGSGKVQSKGP